MRNKRWLFEIISDQLGLIFLNLRIQRGNSDRNGLILLFQIKFWWIFIRKLFLPKFMVIKKVIDVTITGSTWSGFRKKKSIRINSKVCVSLYSPNYTLIVGNTHLFNFFEVNVINFLEEINWYPPCFTSHLYPHRLCN